MCVRVVSASRSDSNQTIAFYLDGTNAIRNLMRLIDDFHLHMNLLLATKTGRKFGNLHNLLKWHVIKCIFERLFFGRFSHSLYVKFM